MWEGQEVSCNDPDLILPSAFVYGGMFGSPCPSLSHRGLVFLLVSAFFTSPSF